MIGRISNLFQRYASRHGQLQKLGFPLWDSAGARFGHIDRISIREGRLFVEGWAIADLVGLTNADQIVERSPSLMRDDVAARISNNRVRTPGFILDMPLSLDHTVFWAKIAGTYYSYALPQLTLRELRTMRRTQILPFLRDSAQALPSVLHWLRYRDPLSLARIKTILGLNTVTRSGQLNAFLFSEDVDTLDNPPEDLDQTGITIVMPVYNAFDLLPEVLQRVLDHTDLPWRLILVEDQSSDKQVCPWLRAWQAALPREMADRIILIENKENIGFVQSVNRGFAAALPFGDHVVLLNSDAFVPEGWASRLIRPLLDHENVATVTPMSNDAEIFNIPVICQREQLEPGEADVIDQVAAQFRSGADLADAPTGVGFCMAMHIDMLKKLPEFDTVFGRGYGEEVDWCQRAYKLGGRHLGLAGLFVEHRGGTSFGSDEKLRLIEKNGEIVSHRYPRYDADVQDFIRNDPLKTPRLALALAWVGQRQRGAVPVYIAHDMGGGAEYYLQNRLKEDLKTNAGAVVLRVGGLSRWQIELHSTKGITRGETDSTDFVARMLGLLPARHLVYSCAVGDRDPVTIPRIMLSLAQGPDDRIEVLVHDFLLLSPSYTLLGNDGIWHGVPMPGIDTDPAHETIRPEGPVDLSEWRAAWGELLRAAQEIRVFSESSRTIMVKAYPDVAGKIMVKPHRLLRDVPRVKLGQPRDGVPVIGVLGNIGYQKGIVVLQNLSRLLERSGRARLVVIGNIDPAYPLASSAHVHGHYQLEDIPALVTRYGISCWLIPSIWPETFSYTTHEALATGLPVFGFDLGAQGDAIRAAAAMGQGGVIPLAGVGADPQLIAETLLAGISATQIGNMSTAKRKSAMAAG